MAKSPSHDDASSTITSVHFDADSSDDELATHTTFNFQPALEYGDDYVKKEPSNFTVMDARLSAGRVIGLDTYRKKSLIKNRHFSFPEFVDLYFCKPADTSHLENKLVLPRYVRQPDNKCTRWAWLCWWRNRACGVLKKNDALRRAFKHWVTSSMFQSLILVVIIIDCIHMATGPKSVDNMPGLGALFVSIYAVEMLIKMQAFGVLLHRGSYFTNPWNWLDFVLTVAGVFSYTAQGYVDLNLSAFRALRTIRILRTISSVRSVRVLVNALFASLAELLEVILLSLFWMVIFALLGLQFFNGAMKRRCVLPYTTTLVNSSFIDTNTTLDRQTWSTSQLPTNTATYMLSTESKSRTGGYDSNSTPSFFAKPTTAAVIYMTNGSYQKWIYSEGNWEVPLTDDSPYLCGNSSGSRLCPTGYTCLELSNIDNPYDNSLSFDSFGDAMLATMQLVILDNWEDVYKKIVHSIGPWSSLFFLATTFFGSFQLLNVILAVIDTSYHGELDKADAEETEAKLNKNNSAKDNPNIPTHADSPLISSAMRGGSINLAVPGVGTKRNVSIAEGGTNQSPQSRVDSINSAKLLAGILSKSPKRDLSDPHDERSVSIVEATTKQPRQSRVDSMATSTLRKGSRRDYIPPVTEGEEGHDSSRSTTEPKLVITEQASQQRKKSILKKSVQMTRSSLPADYVPADDVLSAEFRPRSLSTKRVTLVLDHITHRYISPVRMSVPWNYVYIYRSYVSEAVEHPVFQFFIALGILANVILMATEHDGMSDLHRLVLYKANAGFTFSFLIELLIKLTAYSFKDFTANRFNVFDSVIVLISLVDLFIAQIFPGLTIFRAFRLLRVVRLAKVWETLRILIQTMLYSLPAIGNMTLVAFVMLLTLALFGMHVLNTFYEGSDRKELRWRFTDFSHSMMYAFIIMCGSYIEPLRECVKQAGSEYYVCIISLTPLFIIGNLIILNLYISILLNSFNHETFKIQGGAGKRFKQLGQKIITGVKMKLSRSARKNLPPDGRRSSMMSRRSSTMRRESIRPAPASVDLEPIDMDSIVFEKCVNYKRRVSTDDPPPYTLAASEPVISGYQSILYLEQLASNNKSSVRRITQRIVSSRAFEVAIFSFILVSAICLGLDDARLPSRPLLAEILLYTNIVITAVFVLEMLMRIIAFGYKDYFSNAWNIIDFIIVLFSIYDHLERFFHWQSSLSAFRALRCFRALRPLRFVSRWSGMRIAVTAMGMAIPSVLNVIVMCMIIMAMFAILAVNLFSGRMNRCYNPAGWEETFAFNKSTCISQYGNFAWRPTLFNFNNIGASYLTLLGVATLDSWPDIYEQATDVVSAEKPLTFEANYLQANLFFLVFTVIGAFFTLNLFIGVIIDNFNNLKQQMEGRSLRTIMMSEQQRQFFRSMQRLTRVQQSSRNQRDVNQCRVRVYNIVTSQWFDMIIMTCVIVNVAIMCTYRYGQSKEADNFQSVSDSIFTALFAIEMITKLYAMRCDYFNTGWNILDFTVVILGLISTMLEFIGAVIPSSATVIRIVRMFRIFKTFKLARSMRGLQAVLQTMILSLPALLNVFLLLSLAMFIYALMGIQLFSHIKPIGALDEVMNFKTLSGALMVLFSMMTGTGWTRIFLALSIAPPYCETDGNTFIGLSRSGNCGSYVTSVIYCVSYIVIMSFILINTYIAIVLENFLELRQQKLISDADLENYYEVWAEFDTEGKQFIHISKLSDFLDRLSGSLRIGKPNKIRIAIIDVDMDEGGRIHFTDLMQSLVKYKMGSSELSRLPGFVMDMIDAHYSIHFPEVKSLKVTSSTRQYLVREWAVNRIVYYWRAYKVAKQRKLSLGSI